MAGAPMMHITNIVRMLHVSLPYIRLTMANKKSSNTIPHPKNALIRVFFRTLLRLFFSVMGSLLVLWIFEDIK
jgi:uncharacterized membrane protein